MTSIKYENEHELAAHPDIAGFKLESVLRHLSSDPSFTPDGRSMAAHVLQTGDVSGLWPLNDELHDTQHPLAGKYRLLNAVHAVHLDRAFGHALNSMTAGPLQSHLTPLAVRQFGRALRGETAHPIAEETVKLLRDQGHSDDDLSKSIARHEQRASREFMKRRGVLTGEREKEFALDPQEGDPELYKKQQKPLKYAKVPQQENGVLTPEQATLLHQALQTGDLTALGALGDHLAENGFPNSGGVLSRIGGGGQQTAGVQETNHPHTMPVGGFNYRLLRDGADLLHMLDVHAPDGRGYRFWHRERPVKNKLDALIEKWKYAKAGRSWKKPFHFYVEPSGNTEKPFRAVVVRRKGGVGIPLFRTLHATEADANTSGANLAEKLTQMMVTPKTEPVTKYAAFTPLSSNRDLNTPAEHTNAARFIDRLTQRYRSGPLSEEERQGWLDRLHSEFERARLFQPVEQSHADAHALAALAAGQVPHATVSTHFLQFHPVGQEFARRFAAAGLPFDSYKQGDDELVTVGHPNQPTQQRPLSTVHQPARVKSDLPVPSLLDQPSLSVPKPAPGYDTAARKPKPAAEMYAIRSEVPVKYRSSPALSDFISAVRNLRSTNQEVRRQLAEAQFAKLKLKVAAVRDAISDSPTTASANTATDIQHNGDLAKVRAAVALYALQVNAPSMLLFHEDANGSSYIHKFSVAGSAEKLRKRLDEAGLPNRTLLPTETGWDTLIYDPTGSLKDSVKNVANSVGSPIESSRGFGEVIGNSPEAEANKSSRKDYRSIIRTYERQQQSGSVEGHPQTQWLPSVQSGAGAVVSQNQQQGQG